MFWFILVISILFSAEVFLLSVSLLYLVLQLRKWWGCGLDYRDAGDTVVGFLHPYCMGGGGGERVLWCSVAGLLSMPHVRIVIFVKRGTRLEDAYKHIKTRFGIKISEREWVRKMHFVEINSICLRLIEPKTWPKMTILGQSIGSLIMAMNALWICPVDVFIDTQGFAFSFFFARFFCGAKVTTYTHYPTMSYDMTKRVESRQVMYNNDERISGSRLLTKLKLLYYNAYLRLYGFMGRRAHSIMVNSTWTQLRIAHAWGRGGTVVYPPIDLVAFTSDTDKQPRKNIIVSVAQFRPEKNHKTQLEAFQAAIDKGLPQETKLVIMGSTRNADDEKIVEGLREQARDAGITDRVEFKLNAELPELIATLHEAKVGLHTMIDEHFGITLLELLASDLVVVSHNSGGPKEDILRAGEGSQQPRGYLCDTVEEFADALYKGITGYDSTCAPMRKEARTSLKRFLNNDQFSQAFIKRIAW